MTVKAGDKIFVLHSHRPKHLLGGKEMLHTPYHFYFATKEEAEKEVLLQTRDWALGLERAIEDEIEEREATLIEDAKYLSKDDDMKTFLEETLARSKKQLSEQIKKREEEIANFAEKGFEIKEEVLR